MSQCAYCGSRTGLHGFSFDKNGSYSAPFQLDPEFEPYFAPLTQEEKDMINEILEAKGCGERV